MKYYLDTEFIEGFHKPLFGKRRHHIDLISIGIVAEDGRKYYAISNEYKYKDADKWVQENVILPMYIENVSGDQRNRWDATNFHLWVGKSSSVIANEIIDFINPKIEDLIYKYTRHDCWSKVYYEKEFEYIKKHNTKIPDAYYKSGSGGDEKNKSLIYNQPEFYGYYSDYDWVLFCSLFGRMIDLPKGFPMYCKDLNQMVDEKAESLITKGKGTHSEGNKWYAENMEEALSYIKALPNYPKQEKEHNALEDAKWNKKLHEFLTETD